MFKFKHYLIFINILCLSALFLFQNCAKEGSFQSRALSSFNAASTEVENQDDTGGGKVLKYKAKSQVAPLVANRVLMYNIFQSVFGTTNTGSLRYYRANNIGWNSTDFGSGHTMYEKRLITPSADCVKKSSVEYVCTNRVLNVKVADSMGINTRREAYRMDACHRSVRNNVALAHAVKKIGGTSAFDKVALSHKNVLGAFQLFFRSHPRPPGGVLDSLIIVGQEEGSPRDQWRAIVLAVCLSPHWQVL